MSIWENAPRDWAPRQWDDYSATRDRFQAEFDAAFPSVIGGDPDSAKEIRRELEERREEITRSFLWHYLRMTPGRYRGARPGDLTEEQGADVADRWLDDPQGLHLLLVGPAGTGKTHVATAIGVDYLLRRCAQGRDQRPARWWSVPAFLDALRPGRGDEGAWDSAKSAGLLVLDDLGHTRSTDWAVERMWMLADARCGNALRTVITTNATWAELVDTWGSATMDRFRDGSVVVKFSGDSRRKPLW